MPSNSYTRPSMQMSVAKNGDSTRTEITSAFTQFAMTPNQRMPNLPERLFPLHDLALNLRYTWDHQTVDLFKEINRELWKKSRGNPIQVLLDTPESRLQELAENKDLVGKMNAAHLALTKYIARAGWFSEQFPDFKDAPIAYFSAEFGLDAGLPIYSGGLGALAGDHVKSASDLGVPLIAVGLLYHYGYFEQGITTDGQQVETYPENEWTRMPVSPLIDGDGKQVEFDLQIGEDNGRVRIWRAQVGHVQMYLLDTDHDENPDHIRMATGALYPGDKDARMRQEIVLGIGGARALEVLGLKPAVYHINEGHAAFLTFERIRQMMSAGYTFTQARDFVRETTLFTTHTPVPAGNEVLEPDFIWRFLEPMAKEIGLDRKEFLSFGRANPGDEREWFSMTIAALKSGARANAVSALHGFVARKMWQHVWPGSPENEIPISSVTNGVHPRSWLGPRMRRLIDEHTKSGVFDFPEELDRWDGIQDIPDEALWKVRCEQRAKMIDYIRAELLRQARERNDSEVMLKRAENVLNPDILTVGFARRVTRYKRGNLFFRDINRVANILLDRRRPVQIIFSGKAHPADNDGKQIIKEIFELSRHPRFENRLVFLEDYDIATARQLVAGCDVWLNTPRRPEEASGTSGMKAGLNGALNVSILDGWWNEAYSPEVGWAIGERRDHDGSDATDAFHAAEIYRILEDEVAPLFYERNEKDIPVQWLAKSRNSMVMCGKSFSSDRMLRDYILQFYLPLVENQRDLRANDGQALRDYSGYSEHIKGAWDGVQFVSTQFVDQPKSGKRIGKLEIQIDPGALNSDDLRVEVLFSDQQAAPCVLQPGGEENRPLTYGIFIKNSPSSATPEVARIVPSDRRLFRQMFPKNHSLH